MAAQRPKTSKRQSSKGRDAKATPRTGVQAVERAMHILDVLGEDAEGYRLSDLAARTRLSASTVHRLLTTLEDRSFVHFERREGTWHVGRQLFAIGQTFARRRNFVAAALPVLRALRDETRETTNLGVSDDGQMIIIAQVESREVVRAISILGGHAPMTSDALGKALLATWSDADVAELVARHGLKRETDTTITRMGVLRAELEQVRRDGYAIDRGELIAELRCAAAPVFDNTGDAVAALSVSGLAGRLKDERLATVGERVRNAARQLTEVLGGRFWFEAAS